MLMRHLASRAIYWGRPLRVPLFSFANVPQSNSPQGPKGDENKGADPQPEPSPMPHPQQAQFTEAERELVKNYKISEAYNMILGLDKNFNFQRELIIHRKDFQKSQAELRSAILFEDLLKTQLNILIYDTMGKPFRWQMLKFTYMMLTVMSTFWIFNQLVKSDPRNKVILEKTFYGKLIKGVCYFLTFTIFVTAVFRHLAFRRRFVDKVVYNTEKEQFLFTKRKFFGSKVEYPVSRFHILYTENPFLNKSGINYFNIHNQDEFMMIYKDAWVKQDLFSHLISQRIKV